MAAINRKNILNLGPAKRRRIWDEIRDEAALERKFTAKDLLSFIPGGKEVGAVIGTFLRFSVRVRGLVEFLIGDDPTAT